MNTYHIDHWSHHARTFVVEVVQKASRLDADQKVVKSAQEESCR